MLDLTPEGPGSDGVVSPPAECETNGAAVAPATVEDAEERDARTGWDVSSAEVAQLLRDLRAALNNAEYKGERLVIEYLIRVAEDDGLIPTCRGHLHHWGIAMLAGVSKFTTRKTGIAHPILVAFSPRFRMHSVLFDEIGKPKPKTALDKLRDWLATGELVPSRGPKLVSLKGVSERIDVPYAMLADNSQVNRIIADAIRSGMTSLDPVTWGPKDDLVEGLTLEEAEARIAELKAVVDGLTHVPERWGHKGWVDFGYIAELTGRREPTMEGVRSYRDWIHAQVKVKKTRLPGLLEFLDTVEAFRDWGLEQIGKEQRGKGAATWAREVANQKTNFGKLIDVAKLKLGDEVGDLFGKGFDDLVVKAQGGLVGESAANVRRGLHRWRDLRNAKLGSAGLPAEFGKSLQVLLQARGMTAMSLAHELKLSRTNVINWSGGHASPSQASLADVRRIADFFKVPQDDLVGKLGNTMLGPIKRADATEHYRKLSWDLRQLLPDTAATWSEADLAEQVEKVKPLLTAGTQQGAIVRAARSDEHLMMPFDPSPSLRQQLDAFVGYKVAKVPYPYLRAKHAHWASEASPRIRMEPVEFFYRFMAQPYGNAGANGMGVSPALAAIAWLGHPPMVLTFAGHRAYRFRDEEWDGGKRGIFYTSQEEQFVELAASLTHLKTGWLTQNPRLADFLVPVETAIPTEYSDLLSMYSAGGGVPLLSADDVAFARRDWAAYMARSHELLLQALSYLKQAKRVSRNPILPIGGLFLSTTPAADLLTCIYRSEKHWADQRTQPFHHAIDVRNSAMIRLEGILNLRPKNLTEMLFLPKHNGQIRKVDGVWEVEIPYDQFKNWKNCRLFGPVTSRRNFHKRLKDEAGLYDLLDLFFLDIRNEFGLGDGCPFAFPTKGGLQVQIHDWRDVVGHFGRHHVAWNPVLKTGIPGVASLNPYAFRHIKASDILQNSKAVNKVEEAAFALQTYEPMIVDHYGVLLPDHALMSSGETYSAASELALLRLARGM